MRLNNFSDTHNYCQAIASRCDLNSTTTFPWGALDCKATSDDMIYNQEAWVVSGPTQEINHPPFSWSNWPQFQNNISGIPNTYNFTWQFMDPAANFSQPDPIKHWDKIEL